MEREFTISGIVTCLISATDYLFFGLASNKIVVYDLEDFVHTNTLLTKRTPISMAIVDRKILVCGLKNHAYTAINFRDDFKQVGLSWNASGNDWV